MAVFAARMTIVHCRCQYDARQAVLRQRIVVAAAHRAAQIAGYAVFGTNALKPLHNRMLLRCLVGVNMYCVFRLDVCAQTARFFFKYALGFFPCAHRLFVVKAANFTRDNTALRYNVGLCAAVNRADVAGGVFVQPAVL